ncbi:MAG: hypothetical protein A2X49_09295 [Lentisphaerae bacterium GWF2_52_8]|nr:MAG: hypothetical protein A2X49_09295 [Lentisphaerae bacterium GWF2_52_8]
MNKNAIAPQLLSLSVKGRRYHFRHLFSSVEQWEASASARRKPPARKEHSHSVYHVVLYTKGRGNFNIGGSSVPFQSGLLAITSPGDPHQFGPHADCDEPVEYRNFTFDMISAEGKALTLPFQKLLSEYEGVPPHDFLPVRLLSPQAFQEILPALNASIGLHLEHEAFPSFAAAPAIIRLLSVLSSLQQAKFLNGTSVLDERLLKAKAILESDVKGKAEIGILAKSVGLSPAHFMRAFKAAFGDSPIRFGRLLRLKHARELLSMTDIPIKGIASETGFCDEFHFANVFRREYGMAPSAFRRTAREGRL